MLLDDLARVVARHVEQRDALIVAILLARALAVANETHPRSWIEVAPFDAADFFLTHGRRRGEAHDPPYRNDLPRVLVQRRGYAIAFVLRRASIALVVLSDQAEPLQCDAREIERLGRDRHAMDCRSMGQNRLDISDLHPESDRTCTLLCTVLAELDEALAIEFRDLQVAERLVQGDEAEVLAAADPDADLFHVLTMERDGGFLAVDAAVDVERLFLGILAAQERLVDVRPLPTDLGSPGAGF